MRNPTTRRPCLLSLDADGEALNLQSANRQFKQYTPAQRLLQGLGCLLLLYHPTSAEQGWCAHDDSITDGINGNVSCYFMELDRQQGRLCRATQILFDRSTQEPGQKHDMLVCECRLTHCQTACALPCRQLLHLLYRLSSGINEPICISSQQCMLRPKASLPGFSNICCMGLLLTDAEQSDQETGLSVCHKMQQMHACMRCGARSAVLCSTTNVVVCACQAGMPTTARWHAHDLV